MHEVRCVSCLQEGTVSIFRSSAWRISSPTHSRAAKPHFLGPGASRVTQVICGVLAVGARELEIVAEADDRFEAAIVICPFTCSSSLRRQFSNPAPPSPVHVQEGWVGTRRHTRSACHRSRKPALGEGDCCPWVPPRSTPDESCQLARLGCKQHPTKRFGALRLVKAVRHGSLGEVLRARRSGWRRRGRRPRLSWGRRGSSAWWRRR
jgi:hypothetical protein